MQASPVGQSGVEAQQPVPPSESATHWPGASATMHCAPQGQTRAPSQCVPVAQLASDQQPSLSGPTHTPLTHEPLEQSELLAQQALPPSVALLHVPGESAAKQAAPHGQMLTPSHV